VPSLFRSWRRLPLLLGCLLLACASTGAGTAWAQGAAQAAPAPASAEARRPADVAQILFGIISYVRWPLARPEVRVCMVGAVRQENAIIDTPASGMGQRIRIKIQTAAGAAAECDVVYIGSLPDVEREQLLAQVIGKPILSVSEPGTACLVGTMFCLRLVETQLGFDVNLDAIARSGLRVHPNALQIARRKGPSP